MGSATFRLSELGLLHRRILALFVLLAALTGTVLSYMAVRVFLDPERMTLLDFGSLCAFAVACTALSTGQFHCLHRLRCDTRERIEADVFLDPLTGVYNHRYAEQRLGEELRRARRHHAPVAIVYIDLDRFKPVNDTHGHEMGNEVLCRIAQVLRRCSRREDIVARLGGDEFLIILPETDLGGGMAAAERLLRQLEALGLTAPDGTAIADVSASMGVAAYPHSATARDALLHAADQAMYRAKEAGGHQAAT